MLITCHSCEHRTCGGKDKPKCAGVMLCTVNNADIIDNQRDGCPLKLFGPDSTAPKASTPPKPLEPIPRQDWPAHILVIAATASDQDEGVGDTLKRNIHRFPEWLVDFGTSIKATWNALVKGKKSCGCDSDRRRLNALYPYNRETVDRVE